LPHPKVRWPGKFESWPLTFLLSFQLWALSFFCALAAAPTLDHLFPVAVQAGTTGTVTAIGKFDPWPPQVWVDAPGIVFKPGTNRGKFSVEIAADAPVGPHLVRAFNDQGASGLRFLFVTGETQLAEQEPNDDFKQPQAIEALPVSLNGRLDKSGDVDSFAVELAAGQQLVASVDAFTLASPVDAVLRVVDARGAQVAFNHDGSTLDPFLAWTATSAGSYVVQVFGFAYPAESAVKFTGNDKCVFRLHLSRGPTLRHTLPLGVQRGAQTPLRITGWNVGQVETVRFDGSRLPVDATHATLRPPGFDNALSLPVGDGPDRIESAPGAAALETDQMDVPSAITGCIGKPDEEDRFRFAAKKDEKLLIEIQSACLGFPLDAWLKVESSEGKELARSDDSAGSDPKLEWSAPTDGTFTAIVGNVLHRGGADHLYRLSVRRAAPSLQVNASETAFSIAPGRTNELKVAIKRLHGFEAKLTLSAKNLPDGLTQEPAEVPEKGGEVSLKLVASAEAKPFSGPIQIVATETQSGKEHRATTSLTSSSENNGVPGGFTKLAIESTDQLWLTVLPVAVSPEKKKE
jgi:hypothetical protein